MKRLTTTLLSVTASLTMIACSSNGGSGGSAGVAAQAYTPLEKADVEFLAKNAASRAMVDSLHPIMLYSAVGSGPEFIREFSRITFGDWYTNTDAEGIDLSCITDLTSSEYLFGKKIDCGEKLQGLLGLKVVSMEELRAQVVLNLSGKGEKGSAKINHVSSLELGNMNGGFKIQKTTDDEYSVAAGTYTIKSNSIFEHIASSNAQPTPTAETLEESQNPPQDPSVSEAKSTYSSTIQFQKNGGTAHTFEVTASNIKHGYICGVATGVIQIKNAEHSATVSFDEDCKPTVVVDDDELIQ